MPASNGFLPVYLANGDDSLKREHVAHRLEERISALGDLSFNMEAFDGETAQGGDIVAACNTLPFMSPVRLVTVKNADKLHKEDAEALVTYLADPAPDTVLALYATSLARNTRLYKAVAKIGAKAVIDCKQVARKDFPALVQKMAKSYGLTLRADAANELVALVGEDTVRIDAELKKLSLSHGDASRALTVEDLTQFVGRTNEPKPWDLVDAFSERDAAKCARILPKMESTSPYALLAACINRVRELIIVRTLIARGQTGAMDQYLKAPQWKHRKYLGYARNYTSEELRDVLSAARDTERAMKSGGDPDASFRIWLFTALAPGKKAAARR